MIDISNTFILVWLVVLAIICIYLLYMSLTRNNESDTLKASLANIVRQNKKRDELINFLMERVETLTNAVNELQRGPVHVPAEPVQPDGNYTDDTVSTGLLSQSGATAFSLNSRPPGVGLELSVDGTQAPRETHTQAPRETQVSFDLHDVSLDDVLNSIPPASNLEETITESNVQETQTDTNPNTTDRHITVESLLEESSLVTVDEPMHLDAPISPAKSVQNLNLDDVLNSVPITVREDDLISTILGADDSASNYGGDVVSGVHVDIQSLSGDKIRLMGMNVKQLKQIAKDLNIKSRGNKTELVDSIFEKLNTVAQNHTLVVEELLDEEPVAQLPAVQTHSLVVEDFPDDI